MRVESLENRCRTRPVAIVIKTSMRANFRIDPTKATAKAVILLRASRPQGSPWQSIKNHPSRYPAAIWQYLAARATYA